MKPEYLNVGADKIEREAECYLKNLKPPYSMRSSRSMLMRIIGLCSAAVGGGAVTAAVILSGGL